jgi:arabinofuranosyltransferase
MSKAGYARYRMLFVAIVVGYVACAGTAIWRSSSVVAGERYFVLGDDSMISMRYARNLAAGHGLVWNVGEPRVEGYTNLLWVLIMTAIHELPLSLSKTSAVVQMIGAILAVVNLFVIRRLALAAGGGYPGAIAAVFLTAFYYPLNAWVLSGSEVALLVPVVGIALATAIRALGRQRLSNSPYWILGAATLVRPDAVVIFVALLIAMAALDRPRRRAHATHGLLILAAFAGGQTLFRLTYYGDWLPNTYYLKMTGYPALWRIAWGTRSLMGFVWQRNWILFALAAWAVRRSNPASVLMASIVSAQFAYTAFIGSADNRFTTIVMPLVFVLLALSARDLVALLDARLAPRLRTASDCAFGAFLALSVFSFNVDWRDWIGFSRNRNTLIDRVRVLEDVAMPDARVAVVGAGGVPYFLDRPAIDLLGKNDRALARQAVHPSFTSFKVPYSSGHMKWSYAYSLGELRPDIVTDLWRHPEEAEPYLHAYQPMVVGDQVMYIRTGSTHIRWDRVTAHRTPTQPQ